MKAGAENRKKTIAAGALGAGALVCLFIIYNTFFGGPDTPAPASTTTTTAAKPASSASSAGSSRAGAAQQATNTPGGVAPGVEAQKLATATSSLDPALDEVAMLRTENLVYSGTGRNIFSAVYTPPVQLKPLNVPVMKARNDPPSQPVYTPPAVPLPPPINLKFFGTATRSNGARQAFLLSGDDVYLAAQGDIVARKYKIGSIGSNSVSVTDLTNNNTQTLPLQMQ